MKPHSPGIQFSCFRHTLRLILVSPSATNQKENERQTGSKYKVLWSFSEFHVLPHAELLAGRDNVCCIDLTVIYEATCHRNIFQSWIVTSEQALKHGLTCFPTCWPHAWHRRSGALSTHSEERQLWSSSGSSSPSVTQQDGNTDKWHASKHKPSSGCKSSFCMMTHRKRLFQL